MGAYDRLETRVDVEAVHDPAHVIPHGFGRNPQPLRDPFRRMAGGEVAEDVHLAWREVGTGLGSWERLVGWISEAEHAHDRVAFQ
jgi:hypothetical protein